LLEVEFFIIKEEREYSCNVVIIMSNKPLLVGKRLLDATSVVRKNMKEMLESFPSLSSLFSILPGRLMPIVHQRGNGLRKINYK
jgi:hypothetical protein